MRERCAIGLGLLLVLVASSARGETTFPYKALINGSDVYVRSGPGKNYYPTDKLQRGTEVEVYRHDPGGWCAIRPPLDSFSWIKGEHLRLGADSIAEVTTDKAVAYVGSRFRDVHDVHQVKLDRGELVEVVGEKRFAEAGERVAQTWYKVSPPAGEFRWVYGKLVLKQEGEVPLAEAGQPEAAAPNEPAREPTLLAEYEDDSQSHNADAADSGYGRDAHYEPELADLEPVAEDVNSEAVAVVDYEAGDYETEATSDQRRGSAPRRLDLEGETPVRIASDDEAAAAPRSAGWDNRDLDLELSLIVAEQPDTWDFVELKSRAKQVLETAESALERGRARTVLREIAGYEAIQQDYFEAAKLRAETDRKNRLIEASVAQAADEDNADDAVRAASAAEEAASHATAADADIDDREADTAGGEEPVRLAPEAVSDRFDGVGRLTPVRSSRVGAPQYALTNEAGDIVCFVTPAAGVRLQIYVGKVVGLSGVRGWLPKLKSRHLTAKRVELLEETEQR
ncbi:MAG: SH3 domain-containing protein [Planctomycetota bacterium]|nr:MAG: SH3 domain-containing protein [Planctomycetota bacterium]REK47263.1 MAG: SH3 domain-containing protein [Planctomycetota bacterium]